jgi:hypothetical protein
MRAHRWLKLLAVAALIAFPASLPSSAIANSAFDQYVETPPDSGTNNPGNNDKPPNTSDDKDGNSASGHQNATSGSGTSADPMVSWAEGNDPSDPSGTSAKHDSTSAGRDQAGSDARSNTPAVKKNGFLTPDSSDGGQTPVLLLVVMVLAAVSLAGLTIFRKRRLD